MHSALDAFLLCSVVFFSMGFLALAFYMNREMTKNERQKQTTRDSD